MMALLSSEGCVGMREERGVLLLRANTVEFGLVRGTGIL